MQIHDKWKFIFRYVPGVLRLLRLIVFLVLESTAVRFNITYKGNKARNISAEGSRAYIQSTAPGELNSLKMNEYLLSTICLLLWDYRAILAPFVTKI